MAGHRAVATGPACLAGASLGHARPLRGRLVPLPYGTGRRWGAEESEGSQTRWGHSAGSCPPVHLPPPCVLGVGLTAGRLTALGHADVRVRIEEDLVFRAEAAFGQFCIHRALAPARPEARPGTRPPGTGGPGGGPGRWMDRGPGLAGAPLGRPGCPRSPGVAGHGLHGATRLVHLGRPAGQVCGQRRRSDGPTTAEPQADRDSPHSPPVALRQSLHTPRERHSPA